jgi:hypothetical protein
VVARLQGLDERHAARAIMPSPFISVVTYSVLDGCRLMLAHDRRHFEQARRVTLSLGFPYEWTVAEQSSSRRAPLALPVDST